MKKILPLLLTASILMSAITSVQASDEKTYDDPNGYIFTYIENSNGITLKSCKNNGNSDLVIPKQIDGKTITAIGPCIFDKGFKSLTIEADVKEYSEYMVRDDSDLQIVVLNEGLKNLGEGNFTECKSLKSITLPDSLEEIGTGSLNGCPKLKRIKIPDSVDKIGDFVLCYCPVLSELEWDMTASECSNTFAEDTPWVREYGETHEWLMINNDSVILRYIGKGGNITIPSGVTIKDGACADNDEITGAVIDSPIPDNMFLRCPNLKSAVINTDDIGKNAFKECTSLSEVSMSDNIKIINVGAFIKCTALRSIQLPKSLEVVGAAAFSSSGLESIDIPGTVNKIADGAFEGCNGLVHVKLPDSITELGDDAFRYCVNLKSVNIPDSIINTIGTSAFSTCTSLSDVEVSSMTGAVYKAFAHTPWRENFMNNSTEEFIIVDNELKKYNGNSKHPVIPDGVKVICNAAFPRMDIEGVTIPSSVETIKTGAFYAAKIKELTIPATMKTVEEFAFGECAELKKLVIEGGKINGKAFDCCYSLKPENISISPSAKVSSNAFSYSAHARPAEPVESTPPPTTAPTALPTMKPESTQKPVNTISPTTVPVQATKALTVQTSDTGLTISTDNEQIAFDDAQPFIDENGRTQIPIRAVAEALDCVVDWDGESQTVTLSKDNTTVLIKIGNANMQVGKNIVTMDTTAQIVNDRTYIPVRFVGEALGMKVNWIGE